MCLVHDTVGCGLSNEDCPPPARRELTRDSIQCAGQCLQRNRGQLLNVAEGAWNVVGHRWELADELGGDVRQAAQRGSRVGVHRREAELFSVRCQVRHHLPRRVHGHDDAASLRLHFGGLAGEPSCGVATRDASCRAELLLRQSLCLGQQGVNGRLRSQEVLQLSHRRHNVQPGCRSVQLVHDASDASDGTGRNRVQATRHTAASAHVGQRTALLLVEVLRQHGRRGDHIPRVRWRQVPGFQVFQSRVDCHVQLAHGGILFGVCQVRRHALRGADDGDNGFCGRQSASTPTRGRAQSVKRVVGNLLQLQQLGCLLVQRLLRGLHGLHQRRLDVGQQVGDETRVRDGVDGGGSGRGAPVTPRERHDAVLQLVQDRHHLLRDDRHNTQALCHREQRVHRHGATDTLHPSREVHVHSWVVEGKGQREFLLQRSRRRRQVSHGVVHKDALEPIEADPHLQDVRANGQQRIQHLLQAGLGGHRLGRQLKALAEQVTLLSRDGLQRSLERRENAAQAGTAYFVGQVLRDLVDGGHDVGDERGGADALHHRHHIRPHRLQRVHTSNLGIRSNPAHGGLHSVTQRRLERDAERALVQLRQPAEHVLHRVERRGGDAASEVRRQALQLC